METFQKQLLPVTETIAGTTIDKTLEHELNQRFPADGEYFGQIQRACRDAIAEGWMCSKGEAGRRFGRVIEPSSATGDLSVDVVQLDSIAGPHHIHPTGEICMIMPLDKNATFDGQGAGWCVNIPGSAHYPTVCDGAAIILYLLPGGQIEFTGKKAK